MSLRGLCCNAVLVANNVECGRAFSPIQWLWGDYFLYTAFRSNVMWSCRPGITNVTPDSHKGDVVTGHYCCDTREEGHSPLTPGTWHRPPVSVTLDTAGAGGWHLREEWSHNNWLLRSERKVKQRSWQSNWVRLELRAESTPVHFTPCFVKYPPSTS